VSPPSPAFRICPSAPARVSLNRSAIWHTDMRRSAYRSRAICGVSREHACEVSA
jgi:hypothetical protein